MTLHFVAYGVAQPKGSARAFVPKGWKRPVVTSDNPKNKGWQQLVGDAASTAIANEPTFRLIETAAALSVVFYLRRPKSIRNKTLQHTTKPDLDKLVRSVKDALSCVVWRDDALVVELTASKRYAAPGGIPRAEILVTNARESES